MSFVAWILFGILTGLITLFLDPQGKKDGMIGSILLGAVGAITGSILANIIFGLNVGGISLHTSSIAIAGSLILLFVGRLIKQV